MTTKYEYDDWGRDRIVVHHTTNSPSYSRFAEYEGQLVDKEIAPREIYGEGVKVDVKTAEALEAQAQRLLAYAQEMRDEAERFGEDDYPDGAVITFEKTFVEGGRVYQYAAIKCIHYTDAYGAKQEPNHLWYTTGPKSPKGYTWKQLTDWMGKGVKEIYMVTELQKVVG